MYIQNTRAQLRSACDAPQRREVEGVLRELTALVRGATVDLSLKVGQLVVERFFGGDALNWRQQKQHSLRQLARHPELPMSASALRRCVGLYELTQRVGDLRCFQQLGTSHFRAVLGLDSQLQRSLLTNANEQAWTVSELESHVSEVRGRQQRSRGGRPRVPSFVKLIRQLEPLAEQTALQLTQAQDERELSELDVHEAHARAARLSTLFQELELRLEETLNSPATMTGEC